MKDHMDKLLRTAYNAGCSDIHITVGRPPCMRTKGEMVSVPDYPVLTNEHTRKLIFSIITEAHQQEFLDKLELDCSYYIADLCRFRVNVLMQKGNIEGVLRVIPSKIPRAEDIGLTEPIMRFATLPRGMVLVTGPTGSGKSTTLAALIQTINENRKEHIMTIEDPIEFVYEPKSCVVRQREVGSDTMSFNAALKHVLRQDPDIILVGELRDLETIHLAMTAAETGHLVFATLHTQDAAQTIDRIIDVFPPHQQTQVRVQLSASLQGVVCQQLIPTKDGKGRCAAREVMIVTPAIANLIREGKTHQIYSAIETGGKFGMVSLDNSLMELVRQGKIDPQVAISKSSNPATLASKLGITPGAQGGPPQRPGAPGGPGGPARPGMAPPQRPGGAPPPLRKP